jgi:uncharacterized glyoxalase superfamily protein PhnB
MTEPRVTPMIHVPDVGAAVDWYTGIGFTVLRTSEEDGEPVWALLAFGSGRFMLNAGGRESDAERREVDLYVETPGVDDLYRTLQSRVVTVEEPHDTFYGMREFIIRDLNGFWITFGEEIGAAAEGPIGSDREEPWSNR